jgi:hypothetical protein
MIMRSAAPPQLVAITHERAEQNWTNLEIAFLLSHLGSFSDREFA